MGKISLPKGFITLEEAYMKRDDQLYNVMGVCIDFLAPTRSKGTDLTCKFNLSDHLWTSKKNGMAFRFFQKSLDKMPDIQSTGDVVVIQNMRTKNLHSDYFGMSNSTTTWVVISGSSINNSTCTNGSDITYTVSPGSSNRPTPPNTDQLIYAKELFRRQDPETFQRPPKSTALEVADIIKESGGDPKMASLPSKTRLVKDIGPPTNSYKHVFVDLIGEVRKYWETDFNVELKITDYTENSKLFDYAKTPENPDGDNYGYSMQNQNWVGPWGKMTMSLTLWDEHANFFRQSIRDHTFKPGMYMGFRNVQIKMDKNGAHLEGHCRGSQYGRNSLSIHKPHEAQSNERLKDLLHRKRVYEKLAVEEDVHFKSDPGNMRGKKAAAETVNSPDPDPDPDKNPKLEDSKKRKMPTQRRKNLKKARTTKKPEEEETTSKSKLETNSYVRCEQIAIPLKDINAILNPEILQRTTFKGNTFSIPFQNCKYKSKVRIFDFFPDNIADFAQPYRVTKRDNQSFDDEQPDPQTPVDIAYAQSHADEVRWRWHFFLWAESPRQTMKDNTKGNKQEDFMILQVADEDGDALLNSEACDLRRDETKLAQLREKLFVLWGDLQEKKSATHKSGEELRADGIDLSSRPFECFIKEYGVPMRDRDGMVSGHVQYERMFRICGTTIN